MVEKREIQNILGKGKEGSCKRPFGLFLSSLLTFLFLICFQGNSFAQDTFLEKVKEKGTEAAEKVHNNRKKNNNSEKEDDDKSKLLKVAENLEETSDRVEVKKGKGRKKGKSKKKGKGKKEKNKSYSIGNVEVSR